MKATLLSLTLLFTLSACQTTPLTNPDDVQDFGGCGVDDDFRFSIKTSCVRNALHRDILGCWTLKNDVQTPSTTTLSFEQTQGSSTTFTFTHTTTQKDKEAIIQSGTLEFDKSELTNSEDKSTTNTFYQSGNKGQIFVQNNVTLSVTNQAKQDVGFYTKGCDAKESG